MILKKRTAIAKKPCGALKSFSMSVLVGNMRKYRPELFFTGSITFILKNFGSIDFLDPKKDPITSKILVIVHSGPSSIDCCCLSSSTTQKKMIGEKRFSTGKISLFFKN